MPTLMIQGTTSDAGKSTVVAGLCRWLHRHGVSVAPFKPQNMALNSAVTEDGGEIGRSTALQAQAAGLEAHSDMNPVLLKPESDRGAQVILRGRVHGSMDAHEFHAFKAEARESVHAAWRALADRHEFIVVEGAGSPAEINLRENDIANMGFAEMADCPVLLVGDIDRGGVFAQLVGTLEVLPQEEAERIKGFIINRFRGDRRMLGDGPAWLEQRTGRPVLGVLPWLDGLVLDAEDSIDTQDQHEVETPLRVVIPALPRISNHNDFDPLRLHPEVSVRFVGPDQVCPPADVIILPGSKSTRADLEWLRRQGWDRRIARHLRHGGTLIGICGGFQMLGRWIHDPRGVEGPAGSSEGLGWLDMETELQPGKQLRRVRGRLAKSRATLAGYEIHVGNTQGPALTRPMLHLEDGRDDGAISDDGRIMGTYVHGLFDRAEACRALLSHVGLTTATAIDYHERREEGLERLADMMGAQIGEEAFDTILHRGAV